MAWDINIVGHDVKPASWFLAHHKNVKVHPRAQQDATEGSLNTLGWVKSVTVNVRTAKSWASGERGVNTLLDGHDRVVLALRHGDETPVPVELVDLDEAQEDLFLLIVDALAEMAMRDKQKLDALLRTTKPTDVSLQQMLSDLAAREGLYQGNGGDGTLDGSETGIEQAHLSLSERFLVPPFSVLDARQGYWQERKRAWLALGIQSELGRGEATTPGSSDDRRPGRDGGDYEGGHAWLSGRKANATPGGSPRPATRLGPDGKTRRGDGHGRPMDGEA